MEKFNLEEYLKNPARRVVTRAGNSVRIICTGKRDLTPIVALITDEIGDINIMTKRDIIYAVVGKVFEYSKREDL